LNGYRLYDDYGSYYCNILTEEQAKTDDYIELLKLALENSIGDEGPEQMLSHVNGTKSGMTINGAYYEWDEIAEAFYR
jgi:hypothetical protein